MPMSEYPADDAGIGANRWDERKDAWLGRHPGLAIGVSLVALVLLAFVAVEGIGALVGHFSCSSALTNIVLGILYGLLLLVGLVCTAVVSIVFAGTANPLIGGLFDSFGARSRYQEFNFGLSLGLIGVTLGTVLAFAQFCGHLSGMSGGFSLSHDDFWRWSLYGVYLLDDAFTFGALPSFLVGPPVVPPASWARILAFSLSVFLQLSAFSVLISLSSPLIRLVTDRSITLMRALVEDYLRQGHTARQPPGGLPAGVQGLAPHEEQTR